MDIDKLVKDAGGVIVRYDTNPKMCYAFDADSLGNLIAKASDLISKEGWLKFGEQCIAHAGTISELKSLKSHATEPVAYAVLEGRDIDSSGWGYIASWPEACHEHINKVITEYNVPSAGQWRVIPLYTEPPTRWKSMETAPKDGTEILMKFVGRRPYVTGVKWMSCFVQLSDYCPVAISEAIGWMEIPK